MNSPLWALPSLAGIKANICRKHWLRGQHSAEHLVYITWFALYNKPGGGYYYHSHFVMKKLRQKGVGNFAHPDRAHSWGSWLWNQAHALSPLYLYGERGDQTNLAGHCDIKETGTWEYQTQRRHSRNVSHFLLGLGSLCQDNNGDHG